MRRVLCHIILVSALSLSTLLGSLQLAEASPGGERVTTDVTFGTLSFELPASYRIANMTYGTVEGPPVEEILTKKDGTRETSQSTNDQFTFFAYSNSFGDDHPDLRALIQEKNPSLNPETVFQEGDITVPSDTGDSYPGYYILAFITQGTYVASTYGYLVVLLDDGWVVSFDVSYLVDRQDITSEQGTWIYTVDGQSLIPKHKTDAYTMIISVRISWQSPESSFIPTTLPTTTVLPTIASPTTYPSTTPTETSLPEEQKIFELSEAQGEVYLREGDDAFWQTVTPAEAAILISKGSTVRTGQGSIYLKNIPGQGDKIFIGAYTEVTIGEQVTSLDVLIGKIRVWMESGPSKSKFEIHTPYGGSSVRGTDFIMDTTSERTDVLVFEGTVEFSDLQGHKTVIVKAGETSVVVAGELPAEPQKFDSATVFQKYKSLFESDEEIKDVLGNIEEPTKSREPTGFPIYLLAIPVIIIAAVIILVIRRRRRT